MCFSAPVSFATSALLIPAGIYCLRQARENARDYLPLAAWPLFFGVQQTLEGLIWLEIGSNQLNLIHSASLRFLFFSHFLWLFWTPFSAFSLESHKRRKNLLMIVTIIGFFYGALLYIPLVFNDNLLMIRVREGSIDYTTQFILDDLFPENFSFVTYLLIILMSFLISSNRSFKFLGGLIFLAVLVTYISFRYAFISVWCFFAAILSIYLVYTINKVVRLNFTHKNPSLANRPVKS
jgi:hypothetical protein